MGLFKKIKKWENAGDDFGLLENGLPATAVITAARKTWRSVGQTAEGQPVYELGQGTGKSIAEILATGVSGRATINKISETGKVTEDNGDPILGFVLDVRVDGRDPYELKLFHRVPCEDRPQVTVGLDVPIKALPPDPNEIAIDWANAF